MNNKTGIAKYIYAIVSIVIITIIAICVVESNLQSKASNDGWLSYIGGLFGSLIAAFTSFYILDVNNKENKAIEERNIKYQDARMIASNLSIIHFDRHQYIYRNSNGKYYIKFKLFDEKHIPLDSISIKYIKLCRSEYGYKDFDDGEIIYNKNEIKSLEYTPEQLNENGNKEKEFYYVNIDIEKNIEDYFDKKYYRLEISMSVSNIHNVKVEQVYFVMMHYIREAGSIELPKFIKQNGLDDISIFENYHYYTNYKNINFAMEENNQNS